MSMKFQGIRSSHKTALALSTALLLGLTACGSDSDADGAQAPDSAAAASSSADPTSDDGDSSPATDDEADADDEAGGEAEDSNDSGAPAWAEDVTTPGKKIDTMKLGDLTVTIYQVDTGKAPEDSRLVDKDSKEPLLKKGDPIVFLNYVVTNHGKTVKLGSSLVDIRAKYADWKYLGGMPTVSDDDLMERKNINDRAIDEIQDPTVYPIKKGQTISFGVAFKYQKDKPLELEASYVPVDKNGDLIHDDKVEAQTTIHLK